MKKSIKHKAAVETIINSAAIVISTAGTNDIVKGSYFGFLMVTFAVILEFFKYWGRSKKLW